MQYVVEWLEKLELVCKLKGISEEVACVILFRLTGGAFAAYDLSLPNMTGSLPRK